MTDGGRVLQLLGPSTGGIRRHVAFLRDELRARGWEVTTAGPRHVLDHLGAIDHPVPIGHPARLPWAVGALRRAARDVDIVHAHGLTAGWTGVLARRRPLVVTLHNVVLDEAEGRAAPVWRALERRLPRRVDQVIAVSPDIEAAARANAPATPVTLIGALGPPSAPRRAPAVVRDALGVPRDAPFVVCVARLHPQKGLDVLLDAMPHVPDAYLAIMGEGPDEAALRTQAATAGVADRVRFGASQNAADELAAADVVVIPSRWESGPLVLTEALALERPVVATPVGGVPDLIVDGESGWLVPVGDPARLANALNRALGDRAEAARRAAAGRARAQAAPGAAERVSLVEDVYRASLSRR